MRESVTEFGGPTDTPPGGGAYYGQQQQQQPMGKVWAISERPVTLTDNPENGRIRALLAKSRTPPQAEINSALSSAARGGGGARTTATTASSRSGPARSSGSTAMVVRRAGGTGGSLAGSVTDGMVNRFGTWRKSGLYAARPIAPAPPLVASPGGSGGFAGGLMARDVGKVLPLPELGAQPYSDRRELLCLTGAGLQVFTRLRPVDLLYDLLAQNHADGVSYMCVHTCVCVCVWQREMLLGDGRIWGWTVCVCACGVTRLYVHTGTFTLGSTHVLMYGV